MTKRPTLKVCPFCGSRAYYRKAGPDYVPDDNSMWSASCEIGCATSPDMDTKSEAQDWWNRRHKGPQFLK